MSKMSNKKFNQMFEEHVVADSWSRFVSDYPVRFARLLYRYLSEKNNGFSVIPLGTDNLNYRFEADTYSWAEFVLPVNPPTEPDRLIEAAMIQLEQALELYYEECRLKKEQDEKRSTALAKLTLEERQLLKL